MTWQNQNYEFTRTDLYRDRQFLITTKHAKRSTDIKPTPGSVNADVICSWSSTSVTTVIRSNSTRSTFFPTTEDVAHKALWEPSSPLRDPMQFCKSTTVMTVVLTHYMKLNAIKTFSCSVKTYSSCSLQTNCIANYKITNTKENSNRRTLLIQNTMADGCIMFRVPTMSQTHPDHTSTQFNGKHTILSHECTFYRQKEKHKLFW